MSPSSRASDLAQLREALAQLNSEIFLTFRERRSVCVHIQELKEASGRYSHYDPDREKEVFALFKPQFKDLTLKEVLAFSLIMEDQAMAMAPGSYPTWSQLVHLTNPKRELYEMINPLILKTAYPEFFSRLTFTTDFAFLKDF